MRKRNGSGQFEHLPQRFVGVTCHFAKTPRTVNHNHVTKLLSVPQRDATNAGIVFFDQEHAGTTGLVTESKRVYFIACSNTQRRRDSLATPRLCV